MKIPKPIVFLLILQILIIVLYAIFCQFSPGNTTEPVPELLDVHTMIYVGFGFLMTFLKRYCYSALGFNLLLAAVVLQWSLLVQGLLDHGTPIYITKMLLLESDIMSATILITFGALLGEASFGQMLIIAWVESTVASVNLWFMNDTLKIADAGGSIGIHVFGAYFGLAASWALKFNKGRGNVSPAAESGGSSGRHPLNGALYFTDVTAMIGTLFLWIFWPSFNSALCTSSLVTKQRAIVSTYLALAAATVMTFILSPLLGHERKLDMVHVQNSTLAGGVAVGSVCNMLITPAGALLIGTLSGAISVLGYAFLTPVLEKRGISDTCGVNNLHGMPGILSGFLSCIFASIAEFSDYGYDLFKIFPGRTPEVGGSTQALMQLVGLITTIAVAIITGIVTGFLAKLAIWEPLSDKHKFNDAEYWEVAA